MKKVGLFGNPNTGKSSLFNRLTGLKQRVGNFPGVTVDKQLGNLKFGNETVQIIDFPGTYSIYPRSADEQVVYNVISNPNHPDYPDLALVIVDASNLERNLLLFTQIYDLNIPTVLVLNLTDVASKNGLIINTDHLQSHFPNTTIVRSNARIGLGMNEIHEVISRLGDSEKWQKPADSEPLIAMDDLVSQSADTTARFERIKRIIEDIVTKKENPVSQQFSSKLDRWLVHPILGYVIFFSHQHPGRNRVHGACSVHYGQTHASIRTQRKKCGSAYFQRSLCHSGSDGNTNHSILERTAYNNFGGSVNELQRPDSGLYFIDRFGDSQPENLGISQPARIGAFRFIRFGIGNRFISGTCYQTIFQKKHRTKCVFA